MDAIITPDDMLDLLTDCILRISHADAEQLREIYQTDIARPGWSDEERATLLQAHDTRAMWLNRISVGMQLPRWNAPGEPQPPEKPKP